MTTFEPTKEYNFFTIEECDKIKEYAYKKEEELIREGYTHTVSDASTKSITTTNYFRYNFFRDHPIYAARFVDFLRKTRILYSYDTEWPIAVQSWVNIYRKGEGIFWHNHKGTMGSSFAANIFIDGPTKPGTVYLKENGYEINESSVENKRGYIHIFPCNVLHKVDPVQNERISIGITLHSESKIDADAIDGLIILKENGMIL